MEFGVCYYPEHWPRERWERDAAQMAAAGITLVRIGEFAWSAMEPAEGQYTWEWLDEAIDVLAGAGHRVLLGTPTATPPAWLTRAYPDVLRVEPNGRRRLHGTRRHACPTSPRYRAFSAGIVTAMGERYGEHPAVVGWQIDNEFGGGRSARCYCDQCRAAFQRWLRQRYGTLHALNEAWGTIFWSQSYTAWEQINLPDDRIDKPHPGQHLDYYRFASDAFVEYQQLQVDILRRLAPGRIVTTNFMGLFDDLDQFELARPLDLVTWDNYPTGNPERWRLKLYLPGSDTARTDPAYAYDVGDPYITGMAHGVTHGLRRAPFWVMEQQPGHINWGEANPGIRPGTVRLWTWHAVAAGAEKVLYFRWRSGVMGQEQYHSGLLRHDGEPDLGLRELAERLLPEKAALEQVAAAPYRADVALLCRYDDLWALELQPHRADFHYWRAHFLYYRTLLGLGLNVHLVPPEADLDGYRLLIAPTVHLASAAVAERLSRFVEQGGTLLLGVRSGFKTESNRVPMTPLPGRLRELVGATVEAWQPLSDGLAWPLTSTLPGLDGSATYWMETLVPEGARVMARYGEGGPAAMVERELGAGRCAYVGWYPTPDQARALVEYGVAAAGVEPWGELPAGVLAYHRGDQTVLLNFTDQTRRVREQTIPPRDVLLLTRM